MRRVPLKTFAPALLLLAGLSPQLGHATTQLVSFNVLNATATLPTPFASGDVLRLDTLVTTQIGALLQTINFTVGAGVGSFDGEASWEVSTATSTLPRLIGVNIDIFNAASVLVASDTFTSTVSGFAHSIISGPLPPGAYRLVATGTGVRDSSLDISIGMIAVPEAPSLAMMFAGIGVLGYVALRRRR